MTSQQNHDDDEDLGAIRILQPQCNKFQLLSNGCAKITLQYSSQELNETQQRTKVVRVGGKF
jgi:hypothetical protein